MPTVNFYLKDPKSTTDTPINLVFSYGSKVPFKFGVGDKATPDLWNFEKQRLREKRGNDNYLQRNKLLDKVESTIRSIHADLVSNFEDVDNDILRDRLNIELKRKERKIKDSLIGYLDHIVDLKKETKSKDRYIVKMAADNIKKFCIEKGERLDFKDMNISFRDRFITFLNGKDYKQNTISTCFAALNIILSQAQEDGMNPFNFFRSKKFSAKTEKVKKFSLTEDELIKIHNLDLSGYRKTYEDTRDTFLIGSFTAMRVSDYGSISEVDIQNNLIYRKTQKTGEHVVVPVHWVVSEILEKRGGKFPSPLTQTTINKIIKKIFEIAEINNTVVVTYTKGGKRIDELRQKFQTITTHTARRSGATNMKKAGIDESSIMMLTGHQSYASFKKYIDIEKEENAVNLASHKFFKKPDLKTPDEGDTPQI